MHIREIYEKLTYTIPQKFVFIKLSFYCSLYLLLCRVYREIKHKHLTNITNRLIYIPKKSKLYICTCSKNNPFKILALFDLKSCNARNSGGKK